jgi:hypothetical protein
VNGAKSDVVGREYPNASAVEYGGVATLSTAAEAMVERLASEAETIPDLAATDTG